MPYRNLQDKRAVVTGASSGIGWHLVQQLAAEGVSVIACARRAELLSDLSKQVQICANLQQNCQLSAGTAK